MEDKTIASVSILLLIIVLLALTFGIWGGNPRGVYWQLQDYKAEQIKEAMIKDALDDITLKAEIMDINYQLHAIVRELSR